MTKKINYISLFIKLTVLIILIICGILYYIISSYKIKNAYIFKDGKNIRINLPYEQSSAFKKIYQYEVEIDSFRSQFISINITGDDVIKELVVNDKIFDLDILKNKYDQKELNDYKNGYPFKLKMNKGINYLKIKVYDFGKPGGYTLKIAKKFTFFDFIVYFICFGLSLIWIGKNLFFLIFPYILKLNFNIKSFNITHLIIFSAIVLRILYLLVYGYGSYNHDHHEHVRYIKFIAKNFEIPPPDKTMEFPQQPLYYILSGSLYHVMEHYNINENYIILVLACISCVLNIIFIIYAYKFIKVFTKNKLVQNLFLSFLSFTPSLIFISGRVNNDVLTMTLSMICIYFMSGYFFNEKSIDFYLAVLFSILSFLSKVNSGMLIVVLVIILFYKYIKEQKKYFPDEAFIKNIKQKLFIFGIITVFIAGLTFTRAYLPGSGKFMFANSGQYENQEIKENDLIYYTSFRFFRLLKRGQSFVYDEDDSIRNSFLTYQYGTMLFGEYYYDNHFKIIPYFKMIIQISYILGLFYIIGFAAYILTIKKQSDLSKLLFIAVIINYLLIVYFTLSYPSACNSDFRLYGPVMSILALIYALGIDYIYNKFIRLKKYIKWGNILLFGFLILWIILLLIVHIPNSIT